MIKYFLTFIIFLAFFVQGQEINHKWKLINNSKQKCWYDTSMIDSIKNDNFRIWIMQEHNPPLSFEEINGAIHRSKTLYNVDLKSVKYGIEKVVYYDSKNKEISSFDYNTGTFSDDVKYTYPVTEDSPVYLFIKEYFALKRNNIK
jgi:hypothetical protein